MTQLVLFQDNAIQKKLITLPVHELGISQFNPRATRPDEEIDRLAQRIARNGFEITRALWVYRNGHGYEVFAGGNRLEAARRAGCKTVPVVLHEGLTDEDIVRLAYEDNENDEYHAPVSPVDVWANYAALAGQGWTQEKIGEVVGCSRVMVSYRLNLNNLPGKIKKFVSQGLMTEGHLTEIMKLSVDLHFSPWLTAESAQEELAQQAAKQKLSVRDTSTLVSKLKEVIALASDLYAKLSPDYQPQFIDRLAQVRARSKAEVQTAYNAVVAMQLAEAKRREAELARQQSEAEAERLRLQAEAERNARIESILRRLYQGDFREVCHNFTDNSLNAIITDPPYPEEYLPLYESLAIEAARLLKPGGSLMVMCGQSYLPKILELMTPHLNYQWMISYQTPGGQSPQIWQRKINTFWKPVLWFVKGEYQGQWHGDVIKSDVNDNDKRFHKWGQSESGMARLVEGFTQPDDLILDPFMGGGTGGVVALSLGRQFIGIELEAEAFKVSKERIYEICLTL